jgi:uncharacterized protein (DUF1778 family)
MSQTPTQAAKKHVQLIVEPQDKRILEKAAARAHLPLATWIRVVALNEAQKTQR